MTNSKAQLVYFWSWKKFAKDFLKLYGQKTQKEKKHSNSNVVASVIVAFLIILIAAQTLGFVNKFVAEKHLMEKYKGANVILYSNIG